MTEPTPTTPNSASREDRSDLGAPDLTRSEDRVDDTTAERVRMVVERDSCIGAGQCEMHDDDVFELDDDGLATVIGDGTLPRDRAAAAADRCPGRAISFVELDVAGA